MRTTLRARPSFSRPLITSAEGSSACSQRRSPWAAERGNAWWLWCQDSPNESSDSQATLVDWSSVSNRRVPRKWQTELTLHVSGARRRCAPGRPRAGRCGAGQRAGQRPAGERRQREAEQHEQREAAVDDAHAAVLVEVTAVLARARLPLLDQSQPTCACQRPRSTPVAPSPWPTCGAVRVALVVGVRVVLAMVGDPGRSPGPGRPSSRARRSRTRPAWAPGRSGGSACGGSRPSRRGR